MDDEFSFPDRPADLCDPRCELPLRCVDLVDVSGLEKEELDEFVDREFVLFFSFANSPSSSDVRIGSSSDSTVDEALSSLLFVQRNS